LKVLGAGGMGVVFKAEDPKLKRLIALKVMKPAIAASNSSRRRFLNEAQATAAIKHDHVVTIHQVDEDRGVPFLAMEYLDGESLDACLKREGKLPIPEVVRIGRQIAEGLAAAHARGLIHRDIKLANVWLEAISGQPSAFSWNPGVPDPLTAESCPLNAVRVKLLDFGLARAAGGDMQLTQTGAVLGTPAFMSPEQARGLPVDQRTDLFSLGVVLYRMCTGRMPFQGSDAMSMLLSITADQPARPREWNPEVSAELSNLIMRLLAKYPPARPQSAHAVAQELTGVPNVAADFQSADAPTTIPSPTPPADFKSAATSRRRWPLVAAAVLLIGVILAGGVFTFRTRHGTLVVTVSEPDVKVFIDGEEKVVIDSKKFGKIELGLGQHKLVVKRGNEELYTESFTIKSGDETPIEAKWTPVAVGGGKEKRPPTVKVFPTSVFDSLRREDISPYELAVAGGGGPKEAPAELVAILGDSRLRHWGRVGSLAYMPDGKGVVSGSHDGTVRFWDPLTGREQRVFGHPGPVRSIAVSQDAKWLATRYLGQNDGIRIVLWDLATGKEIWRTGGCSPLAFSPDGKKFGNGFRPYRHRHGVYPGSGHRQARYPA